MRPLAQALSVVRQTTFAGGCCCVLLCEALSVVDLSEVDLLQNTGAKHSALPAVRWRLRPSVPSPPMVRSILRRPTKINCLRLLLRALVRSTLHCRPCCNQTLLHELHQNSDAKHSPLSAPSPALEAVRPLVCGQKFLQRLPQQECTRTIMHPQRAAAQTQHCQSKMLRPQHQHLSPKNQAGHKPTIT